MKLDELVTTSRSVSSTSGRLEKISRLADVLKRLPPDEVRIAIGFLIGWPRQGKIGVGWAAAAAANEQASAAAPTLVLTDVDRAFDQLASTKGKNSANEKSRILGHL